MEHENYFKQINLALKRIIDLLGSFVGLIVLLPILCIVAIAIKVDSPGPIFFLQERIGYKGKYFKIIKFRTMVVNAEKIGTGVRVNDANDSRITYIGKILRKTSLDELPQLINVFLGDMSLVGPRPPVTYHPYQGYDNYPENIKKRFEMRPGITGLAQAKVRNTATWDERFVLDIEYIEKFNVALDTAILCNTIIVVLKSKNIYAKW